MQPIKPEKKQFENYQMVLSADCVVFGFDAGDLKVLLIQANEIPFVGQWSLVGDLIDPKEDIDVAANRILKDLTGLSKVYLEQVHTFGKIDRHPNDRVVSIAYYALVKIEDCVFDKASQKRNASWHSIKKIKTLAFDHNEILDHCYLQLKNQIQRYPIGLELLPPQFTLTELQALYEAILGEVLDTRNFRKKILSTNLFVDTGLLQKGVAHRPAKLFKINQEKYFKNGG